jgi:pimeloyl-ACP methyl ester carboxylesterase
VSTPTSLALPEGVRRTTIHTARGSFAALEASPLSGVRERAPALLVPGFTGSKEDFLAILGLLADGGRQVVAIDMRGQFETSGTDDREGYSASALGSDIGALVHATGARHLLGHSYGGLIAREALLGLESAGPGSGDGIGSFTLMSSGPSALTGPRATELRAMLAAAGVEDTDVLDRAALRAKISDLWHIYLEPQAVASGVPAPIVAFLASRMLSNDPKGLIHMAHHLLTASDRTAELVRLDWIPMLVLYGENDNSWSPAEQEDMARRLGAHRICILAAAHSPAVEAPATTASALTRFWNGAERSLVGGEPVPRPPRHRGGHALGAVSQIVTPAAGCAGSRREDLVVSSGGQAVAHQLVGRGAFGGDVLRPAQVPGQRFVGV